MWYNIKIGILYVFVVSGVIKTPNASPFGQPALMAKILHVRGFLMIICAAVPHGGFLCGLVINGKILNS